MQVQLDVRSSRDFIINSRNWWSNISDFLSKQSSAVSSKQDQLLSKLNEMLETNCDPLFMGSAGSSRRLVFVFPEFHETERSRKDQNRKKRDFSKHVKDYLSICMASSRFLLSVGLKIPTLLLTLHENVSQKLTPSQPLFLANEIAR